MNVQLRHADAVPRRFPDKDAFLAWLRGNEGRYEFVDGKVVEMPGVSFGHWELSNRISFHLRTQLSHRLWSVGTADFAVEIGEDIRFPDVMVVARDIPKKSYSSKSPLLLVEILSPSTQTIDLRVKPSQYLMIPSLRYYLVFEQNEPRVYIWDRDANDHFPDQPTVRSGRDALIDLPYFAARLALGDVYEEAGAE